MPVRWSGLLASALCALVALAQGSCATPSLTELVVVVELGDGLEVPRDLVWLEIRASTLAGQVLRESVPFTGPDARSFPLTLGVRQAEGRGDRLDILVNGYATEDTPSISRLIETRFVPGDRRIVHIVLERACYIVECSRGLTCRGGSCVGPDVDPDTLPRFYGQLPDAGPDLEGGMDAGDSGRAEPLDASVDVPQDAPSDAPSDVPLDTPPDAHSCEGDAETTGLPEGCVLERPPPRSTCGDGGDDGLVRTIALLDPLLDQSGGVWARRGLDLDGFCTNPLEPGTPTECDTPLGDPALDGLGGIDNVLGAAVYATVLAFVPTYQAETTAAAREGRSIPVLRISGWNGLDDDARVRVVFATSLDVLPAGTPLPPSGLPYDNDLPDPAWDGTDTAYVGTNYFLSGTESLPIVSDDNAYVSGRVLVSSLPPRAEIDFPVSRGVASIRLTDARFVATLDASGESFTQAMLVGRWGYLDMRSHVESLGLCPGVRPDVDMFLAAFDVAMRRAMDVRIVPGTGGPGVECDAISASIPFDAAYPVRWGGLQPLDIEPAGCP